MKFLVLIVLSLAPFFSLAQTCTPRIDSCGLYLCEEQKHECGPKGYPLAFGNKFCNVFLQTENEYSESARAWLQKVRVCLMQTMQKISAEPGMTCGGLRDRGFRSHVGCYVETGFCELNLNDKVQIGWAMKKSFVHKEVWRDGLAMQLACAKKGPNPANPGGPQ